MSKKYKNLTYTDGCVCTSLDVDGKEFNIDLTFEERREICHELIDLVEKNNDNLFQEIFINFLESNGEFKDLGQCDCCGDYIYEWKYKMLDGDIEESLDKDDKR